MAVGVWVRTMHCIARPAMRWAAVARSTASAARRPSSTSTTTSSFTSAAAPAPAAQRRHHSAARDEEGALLWSNPSSLWYSNAVGVLAEAPSVDTSGWKTEDLGFASFKLPPNWRMTTQKQDGVDVVQIQPAVLHLGRTCAMMIIVSPTSQFHDEETVLKVTCGQGKRDQVALTLNDSQKPAPGLYGAIRSLEGGDEVEGLARIVLRKERQPHKLVAAYYSTHVNYSYTSAERRFMTAVLISIKG